MHRRKKQRMGKKVFVAIILITVFFAVGGFMQSYKSTQAAGFTLEKVTQLAFYNEERAADYDAYMKKNPGITPEQAVIYCNIGLDTPFYDNINHISEPDGIDVLCNKYNQLDELYEPANIVSVDSVWLRAEAAEALNAMREEMAELGMRLTLRSGYRSYATQRYLYNSYAAQDGVAAADTYSARAGHSEHQTGLAIDLIQEGGRSGVLSNAQFQKTVHYEWMLENAYRFGYILRYPKGYEKITGYMYEPWHWRYVGTEIATEMKEQNISTYDEYRAMRTEIQGGGLAAEE